MVTSPVPQNTDFSRDVIGRYVCNGLDEAIRSTDQTQRRDARPFDIVIIGGGTFGSAIAQHLVFTDNTHSHRVLLLEAGKMVLTEHVQNLPILGLNVPPPTTIDPGVARAEVWGLPWRSNVNIGFPGLAYCVGGRSIYFGGWSPRLVSGEMSPEKWPNNLVTDLNDKYFREASQQIGVNITNDFIFGKMHNALRKQLFDGINNGQVTEAIPLSDPELQNHLDNVPPSKQELYKLEAPLAVQGRPPRSGFFPMNKFSTAPLVTETARTAFFESEGDNVRRRFMIVPDIHVTRLVTTMTAPGTVRVVEILTNQGGIPLPENASVIIALGTIESARLALISFVGISNYDLLGKNLMIHVRSNLTIRIPRTAISSLNPNIRELQASSLFVKGRHIFSDDNLSRGYFHLQITSAGLNGRGTDSEAELFKKIPDIDLLNKFLSLDDTHIVITIRGIGESQSQNLDTRVSLSPELDEYGLPRAFVTIADPNDPGTRQNNPKSRRDFELWEAMDNAADQVATVFGGGQPSELISKVRDGLGTTHHEAGTLWIGDNPNSSVTNSDARFHNVVNAYAAGPSLFPTVGSPNPMLTGIAIARRTADVIINSTRPAIPPVEPDFEPLFDGSENSFKPWQRVGPSSFSLIDGNIVTYPGSDHGILFYTKETFKNFNLRLQFSLSTTEDNSGVFVRFRYPLKFWPDLVGKEGIGTNSAWVAVHTGFEVQIDEKAPEDKHHTGAIYNVTVGQNPGEQDYQATQPLQVDVWNNYEIEVINDTYKVKLNGQQTTTFTNLDPGRGQPPDVNPMSGYLAIQSHTGLIKFRNIRLKKL